MFEKGTHDMDDTIYRQAAIDAVHKSIYDFFDIDDDDELPMAYIDKLLLKINKAITTRIKALPSAQPEDYAELKREFLRMASYIDVLLECPYEQKETLMGFISRIAEFMPWTERD